MGVSVAYRQIGSVHVKRSKDRLAESSLGQYSMAMLLEAKWKQACTEVLSLLVWGLGGRPAEW